MMDLEGRFWPKVQKSDGCWEWQGSRSDQGYGQLAVPGARSRGAHRVSWELHNGPIPDGMLVCHHCDNPPCVRPSHLFLGTIRDNNLDAMAKGRNRGPAPKAFCPHGHPLSGDNLIVKRDGERRCAACARIHQKRWRESHRAERMEAQRRYRAALTGAKE